MKKWMWWVIAALVVVGAGVGVLYGVLTHTEPGFMNVCWVNGSAVYDNPECKAELKWAKQQIPLPVYIDFDEHANKNYRESVEGAMKMWNREIGQVFTEAKSMQSALVIVSWGSVTPGSHAGGNTRHEGDTSGPKRAFVELSEASDVHAVMRFAAHEFGHVLGLAHDEAPRSIMYPVQPGMTSEMQFILPSDHDKELLQQTYVN
jgi:hypothetical protein